MFVQFHLGLMAVPDHFQGYPVIARSFNCNLTERIQMFLFLRVYFLFKFSAAHAFVAHSSACYKFLEAGTKFSVSEKALGNSG
jgi:hypothetical protein